MNKVILGDNLEFMRTCKDNEFDLGIVDPPYEIGRFKKASGKTRFKMSSKMQTEGLKWDIAPTEEYFNELFRITNNQIIWGANNFKLPPTEYFCIWNKKQTVKNFSSAEYAWVSMGLKQPAMVFDYSIHQHNKSFKIHPTQKPVPLYKWLLKNYAKPNDKIFDSHVGSGSIRIACHDMGFDFTGCEIDEDYYNDQEARFKKHCQQGDLFSGVELQGSIFGGDL